MASSPLPCLALTRFILPCVLLPTLVYTVPDPVLPCPDREFVLEFVMNSVINVDRLSLS